MAARQPLRICHAVAVQAFPKVLGFADVEHNARVIAHEVNTGDFGQASKEIQTQLFHQRLRVSKEQALHGSHGTIKRDSRGAARRQRGCD